MAEMDAAEARALRALFGWTTVALLTTTAVVGVLTLLGLFEQGRPYQESAMILLGLLCVTSGAGWARLDAICAQKGGRRG